MTGRDRRLQGDPDVMRYIRAATDDPQVIHDRLGFWINYRSEQPQLGVFIATETASGSPVGYCVARHVEWQAGKELEVGYALAPEFWKRGLATEMTQALVQYVFSEFPVSLIVAFTDPLNQASQKVLVRNGFQLIGTVFIYETNNLRFELQRPQAG